MTTDGQVTVLTWLATTILMLTFTSILIFYLHTIENKIEGATIGGTTVPAVHCAEDEVIAWMGPDALGCVHYEEVN